MSDRFSQDDVVALVARLTRGQLVRFIEWDLVRPAQSAAGPVFRRIDIARLELLCDLSDDLDLDEAALGVVLTLLDQLHAARQDLAVMAHAIGALPEDMRARISDTLTQI